MDSYSEHIDDFVSNNSFKYTINENSSTEILFFEEEKNFKKTILDYIFYSKGSFLNKIINKIEMNINNREEKIVNINIEKTKALIITEKKLFIKFEKFLNELTEIFNLDIFIQFIDEGDFFKEYYEVNKIYEYLLENNFEKNSIIIGLGGGKITDLSGYIASTYFRGINLILIPTNLLAMVDASVGGKTGINHYKYGKNVIGTISQPNM